MNTIQNEPQGLPAFVRAYLRTSTDDQNAQRPRAARDLRPRSWPLSGAKFTRPELFRLLKDCKPGDMLLVEQLDRLSRLTAGDWAKLETEISSRRVRIVALDLPTSWMMPGGNGGEFTGRTINGMLLDMLAAVARKDYEDSRRRQVQGQARAKAEGIYKGRAENLQRNAGIAYILASGAYWKHHPSGDGMQSRDHRKDR